jgi:uncharacterized membrane protein
MHRVCRLWPAGSQDRELRLPTPERFVRLRAQWEVREAQIMAFCPKCGSSVGEGAGFCPSCGSTLGSSAGSSVPTGAPSAVPPPPIVAASGQMDENLAGLLCYVFGWVTGIIFYLIDKRPFVRFHAAQSVVVFGGIAILYVVLGMFVGASLFAGGLAGAGSFSLGFLLYPILGLVAFVLWILLMVKAYQGQKFRIPIAADVAEKIFGVS